MSAKPKNSKKKKNAKKNKQSHKAIELLFLFLFVIALFLLISLVSFSIENAPGSDRSGRDSGWLGQAGAFVAYGVSIATFGRYGAIAIPLVIILALIYWITERRFKIARWVIALLTAGFFTGFGTAFITRWVNPEGVDLLLTGFGPLWLAEQAEIYLHRFGVILLSSAIIIALAIILFNLSLTRVLKACYGFMGSLVPKEKPESPEIDRHYDEALDDEYPPDDDDIEKTEDQIIDIEEPELSDGAVSEAHGPRELPPLKLLNLPPSDQPEINQAELEDNATRLEEKLASMHISAEVVKINPGPIITRYDLRPSAEVKVSRIAGLSDDIAMALKARGVRILAPIPGEAAVGVELANSQPQGIYIREIIGSNEFRNRTAPLTIAIGKDTNGNIFCTDLAKMPHLLIAGATGSGKSVCMNTIITSLLYRCDPNDVRILLIDPKKIELSPYSRLSEQHLVSPPGLGEEVITEPDNAVKALQSVHAEMNRRYRILAEAGVRSLGEYNRWVESTSPVEEGDEEDQREHLPYIVVIIDELADLMMTVRKEFEELVARLAQMARAVGIHLIVATQRPSVDVVTGLIKANFPSRIAFRVATRVDSRTIIDSMGAEALLGKGDMLFFGMGAKLTRLHGALVTTEEVEQVIEFVRAQPPRESSFTLPDPEIQKLITNAAGEPLDIDGVDELFNEAAKIVVRTEQGSVSVLQRRLRVGYARAARLIDQLEQAGIVGPFDGSKARQVMVTNEDLRERYGIDA